MYDQLLLRTGGGIVDRMQQAEQDGAATICIGLGGTGVDCLRSLKRAMYNRIKPDDPEAAIPTYSHIRFIAVDSDMKDMKRAITRNGQALPGEIDYDKEFFDISYPDKISVLFSIRKQVFAQDPAYREWLQFNHIEAGAADDGAGGIRQLGRFLFMQKSVEFVSRVNEAIRQARAGLAAPKTYIHIFSGMSGGTGAGAFLDTCYLVRHVLKTNAIDASIAGYFFLPDVNLSKPEVPDVVRKYIMKNGYASMQELNYCMNFEKNGDCWRQVYPGVGEIRTTKPPVDLCYLISGTDDNELGSRPYQHAMEVVSDYVTNFLIKTDDSQSLAALHANVVRMKNCVPVRPDTVSDYLTLGSSAAVLPFKQVLTYLASKVFEGFAGVRDPWLPYEQSAVFQKTIGFTFDAMLQRLTQGVNMAFPLPDLKAKDVKESGTELLIGPLHDAKAAAEGALARNYTALAQPLQSYESVLTGTASDVQSVMGLVLNAVREAMADPARGPYYAAGLVQGLGGSDLLTAAEGIRAEAVSRRDHEQYQIDSHAYRDYEQREREFNTAGFLKLGGAYREYANAARQLVVFQTRVKMYQTLVDLMDTVKDQLRLMANSFTTPFAKTVTGLFDTFEVNRAELEAFADRQNPYEMPLITMKELMPSLNETVRQMDIPSQAHELLEALLSPEGLKCWGAAGDKADNSTLSYLVSDYFVHKFSMVSSILRNKRAQIVVGELLKELSANAVPAFWAESGYGNVPAGANGIGYLTVPRPAPDVIPVGQCNTGDTTLEVREADVADLVSIVSIVRVWVGISLEDYAGTSQYEAAALDGPNAPGTHLYEPAETVDGVTPVENSRDWTKLPLISRQQA